MVQLQLVFTIFLLCVFGSVIAGSGRLKTGSPAPDFTLIDQSDLKQSLSDYRGQWVLVYFYPKDYTPGCTAEACAFRDYYGDFEKAGLTLFGISTDNAESHRAFAEKHNLPFTLLADTNAEVTARYGVKMPAVKMAKRHSFLIDPDGIIKKIYEDVTPADHPDEILKDLKTFQTN